VISQVFFERHQLTVRRTVATAGTSSGGVEPIHDTGGKGASRDHGDNGEEDDDQELHFLKIESSSLLIDLCGRCCHVVAPPSKLKNRKAGVVEPHKTINRIRYYLMAQQTVLDLI
jgi:hypothetical protein